jgi:DNA-binding PucR family transcriptional regulator
MADRDAVEPIVNAFLGRLDEVVEKCASAISGSVPAYARMGHEFMEDVRGAVRENVSILAHVLSEGREIEGSELAAIERTGARRAEGGIALDDVLGAYRAVARACWDVLSDECRRFDGDALEPTIQLAEAVLRYTDQISGAVAQAHARAQRAIVREQEGARREFLGDLLYGSDVAPEEILARAHTFGYDLSLGYVALVGVGGNDDAQKETAVAAAAATVSPPATADPIVLQKGEHTIALIPIDGSVDVATMPEKLVAELDGEWWFGLGGPEPGLEGVRRAYLEAREAVEVGLALEIDGPIFRFDELLMYHFLRVEPVFLERFVGHTLGPLIEYDERRKGELIRTLETYFESDGSVKVTGQRLFAHPHTVSYRLKQIEKLTGWSLRDAEEKLRLQLALRAHRLSRARS